MSFKAKMGMNGKFEKIFVVVVVVKFKRKINFKTADNLGRKIKHTFKIVWELLK